MDVLRVELECGQGPYRSSLYDYESEIYRALDNHSGSDFHPSPWNDCGGIDYMERCGFVDRAQFEAWFSLRERELLKEYGFKLARYKARPERVRQGLRQVVFEYGTAELIERTELV
jgi:hypothetical protein